MNICVDDLYVDDDMYEDDDMSVGCSTPVLHYFAVNKKSN